ncbi:MAG: LysE family transporter [Bacteroidaceae bacterium]|nr:LysE family transporter [Bacteroidaceae bacterium]
MWFEEIKLLDLTVKGMLIGILCSAPMGPVGVLCIQRTINKGRWIGLLTGVGAAFSDMLYALATGFGMSFVVEFIQDPQNMYIMQLVGSLLLFGFGYYTYRSRPNLRPSSRAKGTLWYNCWTSFIVTLSNPLIIFLFMALFARFTFIVPEHPFEQGLGYISIFLGAMLWWYGLTYVIDKVRTTFNVERIYLINRIIGVIVMTVSSLGLLSTLLGLTLY